MLVQERVAATHFTSETFDRLFDRQAIDGNVETTLELAAADPKKLYYFMQRYAYFNSFAGSLVARLASSIGISYELFRQTGVAVSEQSDRGLEIASKVFAATVDEHADTAAQVPHRTLAQATLQAVGEYAHLSDAELNQIATGPDWMPNLITEVLDGYQGKIGDLEALVTALGFHLASELLADREYALIDKVIRHTHRGVGFDAWLQGKQVEIAGKRLSPWYWIVVHGKYNSSAVEAEHSEFALEGLNLLAKYRPESNDTIFKWAAKGFLDFARIQQELFLNIKAEIEVLAPSV
jgi:hypothetical protein